MSTQPAAHHDSTSASTAAHSDTAHVAGAHGASAEVSDKFTFNKLLDQLGDHHELNIFFGHYEILPVILLDEQSNPHIYPNLHAMEEAGVYTMHHHGHGHHIVRTHAAHTEKEPCPLPNPAPSLDLSVTNFVAYQWIAMILVTIVFGVIRGRYKKNPISAPRGLQNAIEAVVLYVHDQIVRPNVGTDKRAMRLMPFMLSLFFFILSLNLISLLPGAHAATGALPVTMALATCTLIVVNFIAIKDAGIGSWFKHLLGGAPAYIAPIMVPIELVGIITKPFALMIRLFANMTAGHIVLLSLVGLIFFFAQEMGETVGWGVAPISVLFSVFIYLLELLVAFLQAYIFTMLSAVFVGLALGDHAAHDHHHDHAASH
jgi:F-type H+-transporting ATPase subunit a